MCGVPFSNIGEITQEKPGYRFPAGLQKGLELFGAYQLKEKAPHRVVFLVELPFAVMPFSQRGFSGLQRCRTDGVGCTAE
jgi:hypothetical protein